MTSTELATTLKALRAKATQGEWESLVASLACFLIRKGQPTIGGICVEPSLGPAKGRPTPDLGANWGFDAQCIAWLMNNALTIAAALDDAERELKRLRGTLREIDQTLRIPAAEYVPAIGDVFNIIDRVLPKETR